MNRTNGPIHSTDHRLRGPSEEKNRGGEIFERRASQPGWPARIAIALTSRPEKWPSLSKKKRKGKDKIEKEVHFLNRWNKFLNGGKFVEII